MDTLASLEWLFGWVYFFAWSATFYPQVTLIFKRRTTAGLSTDFMAINIVGFVSYLIFTFSSFYLPQVAEAYKAATGFAPQVELVDVLFAAHGALMCAILILQLFYYPPRIPPKKYVSVPAIIIQAIVFIGLVSCLVGKLDWFNFLSFAGSIKVFSSLIKHFPQVWLNRSRGSTVGWSYTMILIDVVGGSFSMAQQFVKALRMGNLAPFTSNLAKTFLAAESLLFDFWFILQHTVFYSDHTDIDLHKMSVPSSTRNKHPHSDHHDEEAALVPP